MKKCKENQDHTLTTKLEKTNKPERIMTHYFNCKGQSHLLNQMCQTDTSIIKVEIYMMMKVIKQIRRVKIFLRQSGSKPNPKYLNLLERKSQNLQTNQKSSDKKEKTKSPETKKDKF